MANLEDLNAAIAVVNSMVAQESARKQAINDALSLPSVDPVALQAAVDAVTAASNALVTEINADKSTPAISKVNA